MSLRFLADDQIVPGVRAVSVLAPAEPALDAATIAGLVREAKSIPASVACRGEGEPVAGGVQWVFVFTG